MTLQETTNPASLESLLKKISMEALITKKDFISYVENYKPFPWNNNENDPRPYFRNKHSLLTSFQRYFNVLKYLSTIETPIRSIVDVGPYPGIMVNIIQDLVDKEIENIGIGLSFSQEYKTAMKQLGVRLFNTDVDPDFIESKECKEWPDNDVDLCLLLDVIEHLVNPVYCLDQINRSLKPDGYLILTTDNISSFGTTYNMLRKGASPNVHPLQSSLFYRGEWRPHFRELSKNELLFYLEHCGFHIVKHEYFERKQGDFCLNENGKLFEISRYSGLKGILKKSVLKYIPHLRDHQILIAKKIIDYEINIIQRPNLTYSMDEWLKMRADAGVF